MERAAGSSLSGSYVSQEQLETAVFVEKEVHAKARVLANALVNRRANAEIVVEVANNTTFDGDWGHRTTLLVPVWFQLRRRVVEDHEGDESFELFEQAMRNQTTQRPLSDIWKLRSEQISSEFDAIADQAEKIYYLAQVVIAYHHRLDMFLKLEDINEVADLSIRNTFESGGEVMTFRRALQGNLRKYTGTDDVYDKTLKPEVKKIYRIQEEFEAEAAAPGGSGESWCTVS